MKTLYVFSQYRVGERIFPTIEKMKSKSDLDCLLLYQMSDKYDWPGNNDLRKIFHKKYDKFFDKISSKKSDFNFGKYDVIICDDNRDTPKTNLSEIYAQRKGVMIGCYHGPGDKFCSSEHIKKIQNKICDFCFVIGSVDIHSNISKAVGIPSNDVLKKYLDRASKHILLIVNFLGNRYSPFKVNFDGDFIDMLKLKTIQKNIDLPFIFKLKSREDEGKNGYAKNTEYLNKILPNDIDYEIMCDHPNNDELISESALVISSTGMFTYKPIQLGVPTVIIKDSGLNANFHRHTGFMDINNNNIGENIYNILREPRDDSFITDCIAGGLNFESTDVFINEVFSL